MRVLLFAKGPRLRHFDSVLLALARSGHEVRLVVGPKDRLGRRLRLAPRVRRLEPRTARGSDAARSLKLLRLTRDYLRYLDPPLDGATVYRERARDRLLQALGGAPEDGGPIGFESLSEAGRASLRRTLVALEELVPPDRGVVELLAEQRPDVVLVTPLVALGSPQTEVVKAARALGIPSGALIFSWDNLSNKGSIHVLPDAVFVWNELQRREAIELHGVPAERVVVTGAPRFDAFFAMRPHDSRETLCARHRFDPSRPIVLYLGSSKTITTDEPTVVRRWLEALRATPSLRDANVLVRPHPTVRDSEPWRVFRATAPAGVSVSAGDALQGDQCLYDEIFHCAAAVALNTSAEIEASILGKPVFTFDAGEELAPGQRGSVHYYYLLREHGGVVDHAPSLAEHVPALAAGVVGGIGADDVRRWVSEFVRPHGIDRAATPILADAIVALAGRPTHGRARRLARALAR